MYKALCIVAILLGSLALNSVSDEASSNALPASVIVARATLFNQAAPIQKTTIFTPRRDGLFRISSYMAMTKLGSLEGYWTLQLGWTDDTGEEAMAPLELRGRGGPPDGYGVTPPAGDTNPFIGGGSSFVIRAVAGTPITYAVANNGTDGTYEVFLTIERID